MKDGTPKAKLLWVGKRVSDTTAFVPALENKGYPVQVVPTGKAAIQTLDGYQPDIVIVDAASMRTSGSRICDSIHDHNPDVSIILINSQDKTPESDFYSDFQLILPFTIRKLENRIIPLSPGNGDDMIEVGPIQLDVERQVVRTGDREEHITPRMTDLLRIMLEKPGVVHKRETLFKKVWNTNYTEDTRSLDVHINWLRKAIEADPSNPELIITVRGRGYKIVVREE